MFIEKYEEMYQKHKQGIITTEVWNYFCRMVLEELMNTNQDLLKRLKNM